MSNFDKLYQQTKKAEKKKEQRELEDFHNGGYQRRIKELAAKAQKLSTISAKAKGYDVEGMQDYSDSVKKLRRLAAQSSFGKKDKQFLTEAADSFSSLGQQLREASQARAQQDTLRKERDKTKTIALPLKALAYTRALLYPEKTAIDAVAVANDFSTHSNKKIDKLQRQIDENYSKYVATLDREALKTALHDGSVNGKAKKYLKEDYQAADEFAKATAAAKALENSREIEALARSAGERTSAKQEKKAGIIYKGIAQTLSTYRDPKAAMELSDYFKNKKYAKQNREKIVEALKRMGFTADNGVTAEDVADYLIDKQTRKVNYDKAVEMSQFIEELSQTAGGRVFGSTMSLMTAPLKGISSAETIKNTIKGWISDEKVYIDPNDPIYSFNNLYSNVLNANANALKEKYGDDWGTAMSEAYTFGMNLADNIIRAVTTRFLGGGNVAQAVTLLSMGAGVMNDTAIELTRMGMDARQAGTLAAVAGAAEIVTEMVPLENLMDMLKNRSVLDASQIVRNLVSQILTEGAEEGASDLINDTADLVFAMLTDSSSKREMEIRQLMDSGMSFEDAYKKWSHDHVLEYVKDIGSGMLSGFAMSGGAMAGNAVMNNLAAGGAIVGNSKRSQRQSYNAEIQAIMDAAEKEGHPLTREQAKQIRMNEQLNSQQGMHSINPIYDSIIEEGLQSSDAATKRQAQQLAILRDGKGKLSVVGIGRLSNRLSQQRTNASMGVAAQILDEVGASEAVKDAVQTALRQEELSKKDAALILGDENARNLIAELSGVELDEDSNADDLAEAVAHTFGRSFGFADSSTDFGKAYTMAAELRADGAFGKDEDGRTLGTNAMRAFYSAFSPAADMSLDDYSLFFQYAYNSFYGGNSAEQTARGLASFLQGIDPETEAARQSIVLAAKKAAQADKELLERHKAEKKLDKKQKEEAKEKRREAKKQKEAEERAALEKALKSKHSATVSEEEIADGLDNAVLKKGESVKAHADSLTIFNKGNENNETALDNRLQKVKRAGGGAVVFRHKGTKLSGMQATIIAFYEYLGKKYGITYLFTDNLSDKLGGEYKDGVITVSLSDAASMAAAAGHELGHWLEEHYSEDYADLKEYVKQALEANGMDVATRIVHIQNLYKTQGQRLSPDEALSEIVNNSLFSVDLKSDAFTEFMKEHMSFAQAFLDKLRQWIADLEEFFGNIRGIEEVQVLKGDKAYLEEVAARVSEILNKGQKENTTGESGVKYSVRDTSYMEAARNGDEETAAAMVEQAAKDWGAFSDGKPMPINFYHGTDSFGFTKFDLQRMDDRRSIFLTSDETTAQTYSGVSGVRKIGKGYQTISADEVVQALNDNVADSFFKEKFYTLDLKQQNEIINRVNINIDLLRSFLENNTELYAHDNIANSMIGELLDAMRSYDYEKLANKLLIGGYNHIGQSTLGKSRIDIESFCKDTNILNAFLNKGENVVVIQERNPYFHTRALSVDEARDLLAKGKGNYSLYAKFEKPFVLDNDGRLWREARLNVKQAEALMATDQKEALERIQTLISALEKDEEWVDKGYFSIGDFKQWNREKVKSLIEFMQAAFRGDFITDTFPFGEYKDIIDFTLDVQRLKSAFDLGTNYTLRDIAEKAQKAGYDGVVFKNVVDNGGRGMKDSGVSDYIAVAFDSSQVKSADPVTYDDNGEIIPLSKRFSESKDIRYQVVDSEGEQLSKGQEEYFGNSKVKDKDGNLLRVYHGTSADFTVFDPVKYGGQTGSDHGKGIYFTSVPAIADRYGNSDKVYYLNITKPAFDNKVTLTKSEVEQLVKASAEYEAQKAVDYGDYDDFDEALQDSFVSAYGGTYSATVELLLKNNYNDVDIIYDIMNAIGANADFESAIDYYNEVLTPSTGIDGFQTRFTHAADDGADKSPNVFVAFNSNQAKLTSNTTPTDNKDIRYMVKDTSSIKEQLKEKADILNNMPVVADVTTPTHFKNTKEAKEWALSILKNTGYKVDRENFGVIVFDEKRINRSLDYLETDEEIAAFAALPRVLKRGIEIDGHSNHKNRGYDTVTIAAPIILNGTRGNMAVIVTKTKGNHYKTHRIVLPNGAAFVFMENEETEPTPSRGYSKESELAKTISSASESRVSQSGNDVKHLIYDTDSPGKIKKQEAELARFMRDREAYIEARKQSGIFSEKLTRIRRELTKTMDFPTYQEDKVEKVADAFLKKYGITDELSKEEHSAFLTALHRMYQQIDGTHRFGYTDESGKKHEPLENAAELADAYAMEALSIIRDYMTEMSEDDGSLQHIKEYFSGKTVYLPEEHWQEVRNRFDTITEANKAVPFVRFAKTTGKETSTIEDAWTEAGLDVRFGEKVDVNELIDLLQRIKNGTAQRVGLFEYETEQGASEAEILDCLVLELQGTWAQVQWERTFADNQAASVQVAKMLDEQAGKTNRHMALLAQYKKTLQETMQFSRKAVADLQKAYAKENEKTLELLRTVGEALAREQEQTKQLSGELGTARAAKAQAQGEVSQLSKTVEALSKDNAWLKEYVDNLTEEQKQTLIEYAEASKKLRRAEKKVETRERRLEAEKEKHKLRVQELQLQKEMQKLTYQLKLQETRANAVESKRKTEYRQKIRRKYMSIASIAAANSKKQHVPNGLIDAVRELLQAFNVYKDGTKAKLQFDSYLSKIGAAFTRMTEDKEYEGLYAPPVAYIEEKIKYIRAKYGIDELTLEEMSADELEDINDLLNAVIGFIEQGNRIFADNLKASTEAVQETVAEELKQSDTAAKDKKSIQLLVDNYKPVYFFRRLGSKTLEQLFYNVYDGENTWARDIEQTRKVSRELRKKYHYSDWNQKETFRFELASGQTLELNLQQIMSLYALSRREDAQGKLMAWKHLLEGGIEKVDGTEARKGFFQSRKFEYDETRYIFTEQEIKDIIGKLTADQKGYVEEAQAFLSKDVARWGNEVSEQLYDVHLFKGKIYFPMQSASDWIQEQEQKTTGARQIKNFGASQEVMANANNPLMLGEFNDIFGDHINDMALYHAFVLPLEDLQRVYGYRSVKKNQSVRKLLGKHNKTYLDKFIQDMNGGVKAIGDLDIGNRLVSRWKKVSVSLNTSVIIQQPSAVGRAFAYIEPKYFAPVLPTDKLLEEMMTYAPIARIKSMGYFDVDLGKTATEYINENEYEGLKAKGKAVFTDRNYREQLLTIGAEKADEITWAQIWNAAKNKAKAQGFTGEEQLEKAGEIFTECIRMTQVYDSVFSRSGNMRKKGWLASAATAFMSEPTTAANMIVDAFSGLKSGRTTAKFATGVTASVLTATVLNALLKAIVQTARHADDDDDLLEVYPAEFVGNLLDDINPLSYIPWVKDAYNIFAGKSIQRVDMALIEDFANSIKRVTAKPDDAMRWAELVSFGAQIFGIPAEAFFREVRTAWNFGKHIFAKSDERTKAAAEATANNLHNEIASSLPIAGKIAKTAGAEHFLQSDNNNYSVIYSLIKAGKKDEAMKRFKILQKSDPEKYTEKSLQSGIRNLLKKDKNIIEAAQLWNQGKAKEARAKLDTDAIKNFDINDRLQATMTVAKALKKEAPSTEASDKDYSEDFETGAIKNLDYAEKAAQGIMDADYYAVEENFNALLQMGYSEEDAEKAIISMANKAGKEDEDYISATSEKSLRFNTLVNEAELRAAAEAAHAGDVTERVRLQDSLLKQGYSMNDIGAAMAKVEKKLYPSEGDGESGEKSYYKYRAGDVVSYLQKGDTRSAAKVTAFLMDAYEKDGKKADSAKQAIRTKITNTYKAKFRQTSYANREKIMRLMLASGAYKDAKSVEKVCRGWLKKE